MPLAFLRDGAACARARPAVAASSGPTSCRRGRLSREGSAYPLRRGGHALHTISLFRLSPKVGKIHLKAEIIQAQRLAVDEDGAVLVWTGESATTTTPVSDTERSPLSYTPRHLAEKIL